MKLYSVDLRERVLAAVDRGVPRAEVCATFAVSEPTVRRWLRRRRLTGGVAPTPARRPPAPKGGALLAWLPARLAARPDATLEELAGAFAAEEGVAVSTATVSRAVAAAGWTRKKRAWSPPSATPPSGSGSGRRWPPSTRPAWSSSTRPTPTSP